MRVREPLCLSAIFASRYVDVAVGVGLGGRPGPPTASDPRGFAPRRRRVPRLLHRVGFARRRRIAPRRPPGPAAPPFPSPSLPLSSSPPSPSPSVRRIFFRRRVCRVPRRRRVNGVGSHHFCTASGGRRRVPGLLHRVGVGLEGRPGRATASAATGMAWLPYGRLRPP